MKLNVEEQTYDKLCSICYKAKTCHEQSECCDKYYEQLEKNIMDLLAKHNVLKELDKKANKIIAEKHLKFDDFLNTNTLYEYNLCISNLTAYYQKLNSEEYKVLLIVVKREYDRLEYTVSQEEKEAFWEEK